MTFRLILFGIFTLRAVYSHDSDSTEINRIEVTPYYDTIIVSDVADIINEFQKNMNPIEAIINSSSDSEENIEDLLAEYQQYLEKAHNQRLNYLEKTKLKNKVPLKRHDRYGKTKSAGGIKYDDFSLANGYLTQNTIPQPAHNVVDFYIPLNSNKLSYLNKPEYIPLMKDNRKDLSIDKKILQLPPVISEQSHEAMKLQCPCKNNQIPCDCRPCKQCTVVMDSMPQSYVQLNKMYGYDVNSKNLLRGAEIAEEKLREISDNTLNIKIKVDIQLPKTQEVYGKHSKNLSHDDIVIGNSKESQSVNFAFPYFNFPIPMDLLGYKKPTRINNHDLAHKITIHKKKKSRPNNVNKKHNNKNKKDVFHNLIHLPDKAQAFIEENNYNNIEYRDKNADSSIQTTFHSSTLPDLVTQPTESNTQSSAFSVNNTKDGAENGTNQTETEDIVVTVNITNNSYNGKEDIRKTENSVETQDAKKETNSTVKLPILRRRREITNDTSKTINSSETVAPKPKIVLVSNYSTAVLPLVRPQTIPLLNDDMKKNDKALLADSELLYWPDNNRNQTASISKNITTIILERENNKTKLNMSKEAIRSNHTRVLEKAIFGEVNWDDVDTVAPVFLSFVGKYLTGVLTFCSQNVCHSMKCREKSCVHRICAPSDRWNQKGHCAGSNNTDSIASLESIMDLPSNVVFEIVDILQDKMLGNLYGKVTLCIGTKCVSFVACKKNFLKSKCTVKELKMGYCPIIKNIKIM